MVKCAICKKTKVIGQGTRHRSGVKIVKYHSVPSPVFVRTTICPSDIVTAGRNVMLLPKAVPFIGLKTPVPETSNCFNKQQNGQVPMETTMYDESLKKFFIRFLVIFIFSRWISHFMKICMFEQQNLHKYVLISNYLEILLTLCLFLVAFFLKNTYWDKTKLFPMP